MNTRTLFKLVLMSCFSFYPSQNFLHRNHTETDCLSTYESHLDSLHRLYSQLDRNLGQLQVSHMF